MKKTVLTVTLLVGLSFNGLDADIKAWFKKKGSTLKRGTQCAFAPKKYKCSKEERETARKWLIGSTVAAVAAGTVAAGAAVTAQQIQQAREQAAREQAAQREFEMKTFATDEEPVPQTVEPSIPPAPPAPPIPGAPPAPPAPPIPGAPSAPPRRPLIPNIKELARDLSQTAKAKVTPMQEYFERQVIEKGSNLIQQASEKMKTILQEKTEQAKKAIDAAGELKEAFAQKAAQKLAQAQEAARTFIANLEDKPKEFYNTAVEQVVGIRINLIQPLIDSINEYIGRSVKAIMPLSNVRLFGQINAISQGVAKLTQQGYELSGKWREAIRQLGERAAWIRSHVRPVALGGKPSEQIEAEADQHYPLAKIADQLWTFYPSLVREVNELKLGGPGLIVNTFLRLSAQMLNAIQNLNSAVGKLGRVIISKNFASALGELQGHLETLAAQLKQTLTVKPILKEFPQSTPSALLEVAKGYAWRVGTNLPTQIASKINKMSNVYFSQIAPAIASINEHQARLISDFSEIPELIKEDVVSAIKRNPLVNTMRSPLIIAQSLGFAVTVVKELINKIAKDAITTIQGLTTILQEAPSVAELVNTAVGGEFINSSIVNGLKDINRTTGAISRSIEKVNQAIRESAAYLPAAA